MTPELISEQLSHCKLAARRLRLASSEEKNAVLRHAVSLLKEKQNLVLTANARDLASLKTGASSSFRDRLTLNKKRIEQMALSLEAVAALPDPVGEEVERVVLENGLVAKRMRAPLGIILMIFESRPNVILEAFSLALKTGNVIILRGGKESMQSAAALYEVLRLALERAGLSRDSFWGITDADRSLVHALLQRDQQIDLVVPRGGEGLISFVTQNTRIPVIKNDRGLCHVYVHDDADIKMALSIVANAKTSRPGVCNAMETLLVHSKLASQFLPLLYEELAQFDVNWFSCAKTLKILSGKPNVSAATESSWDTEYLDFKMNCKVVEDISQAISHIDNHGSHHSEAIVTSSADTARRFQNEVDAAAVYWNASTRFTDGYELGLGGELGISTQKLHVRGPVGLRELTSPRWVIEGNGQIRPSI